LEEPLSTGEKPAGGGGTDEDVPEDDDGDGAELAGTNPGGGAGIF
jgi:hypothetical protein